MAHYAVNTMKTLLLMCIAAVLMLAACGGPAGDGTAAAKARDPVCGMDVDPAKSLKAEHEGKTYYFCSEYCKEQFEKDPAKFTQAK